MIVRFVLCADGDGTVEGKPLPDRCLDCRCLDGIRASGRGAGWLDPGELQTERRGSGIAWRATVLLIVQSAVTIGLDSLERGLLQGDGVGKARRGCW